VILVHLAVAAATRRPGLTLRTLGLALVIAGIFGLLLALVVAIVRGELPRSRLLGRAPAEEKGSERGADGEDEK